MKQASFWNATWNSAGLLHESYTPVLMCCLSSRCTAAIPGVQLPFHLTAGLCLLLHKMQVRSETTPQSLCPSHHDQPLAHEGGSAAALHPTTVRGLSLCISNGSWGVRHGTSPHSTRLGFKSEWAIEMCSLNSKLFTFCAVTPLHFFFEEGNCFYLIHYLSSQQKWLFHEMKYQNLCLLLNLNLTSFNFEPLFHCFLLALIGGICFPIMMLHIYSSQLKQIWDLLRVSL